MRITVIVATRNRAQLLAECLEHLARQAFQPGDELIVVDNGSTDGTGAVVERQRRTFPIPLHGLCEPCPGKSLALRRALSVAAGEVIAFTDDDVNVGPSWIAEIRRAMAADPELALVGGPVKPRWERLPPHWLPPGGAGRLAAPLALLDYGPYEAPLGERTAIGANLAVRRAALSHVGGFATHLGKLAGTLLGGEDHELCNRVRAAGLRARYLPSAIVFHWVPAGRLTLRYFVGWFFWSGITFAALEPRDPRVHRSIGGVPLYLVRRFAAGLMGAVGNAALFRSARAVDRITEAAFAAGYALARWGLVGRLAVRAATLPIESPS